MTAIAPENCWERKEDYFFRLFSGVLAVSFREHKLVVFYKRMASYPRDLRHQL